jgi:hypothetical protein
MPDPRPAQQIGDLLTQSGVPANHSLDIAQRLLTLADSSQTAGGNTNAESREITASQARSSSFKNQFRSKEQTAVDGEDGRAGKDGLSGYNGTGVDGKDGEQGGSGSAGRDGQVDLTGLSGIIFGLLPGLLDKILTCTWFRKKAQACLQDGGGFGGPGCQKPPMMGDMVCCNDGTFQGPISKKSVCSALDFLYKEVVKLREKIDECCGGGDPVRWVCINNTCKQRTVASNNIGSDTEAQCSAGCGGNLAPKMWFWCDKTTDPRNPTCRSSNNPAENVGPIYSDQIECQRACLPSREALKGGPGTELKRLLAGMGYETTENCPCNARAREMDENGVQWVKDNRETVIDWLEEQAKERGSWIFTRAGAAALIEVACLMAGKDDQSETGGP